MEALTGPNPQRFKLWVARGSRRRPSARRQPQPRARGRPRGTRKPPVRDSGAPTHRPAAPAEYTALPRASKSSVGLFMRSTSSSKAATAIQPTRRWSTAASQRGAVTQARLMPAKLETQTVVSSTVPRGCGSTIRPIDVWVPAINMKIVG
jgi:hypothetical protein